MKRFVLTAVVAVSATATAHAQLLSDATPVRTTTANSVVYTKELTAFNNYGTDGRADILYTGNTGVWTFNLTATDLGFLSGTPIFTATMAYDDHYSVPVSSYSYSAAINGVMVNSASPNPVHGGPFNTVFNNWASVDFSGVPFVVGTNTLRITNTSTAGGTDWLAVDRIRLTLPTTVVPEPSSILLLAIPAFYLGSRFVRRKRGGSALNMQQ